MNERTTTSSSTSDEDLESAGSKKSTDIEGIAKCSDDVNKFASILLLKENYCILLHWNLFKKGNLFLSQKSLNRLQVTLHF